MGRTSISYLRHSTLLFLGCITFHFIRSAGLAKVFEVLRSTVMGKIILGNFVFSIGVVIADALLYLGFGNLRLKSSNDQVLSVAVRFAVTMIILVHAKYFDMGIYFAPLILIFSYLSFGFAEGMIKTKKESAWGRLLILLVAIFVGCSMVCVSWFLKWESFVSYLTLEIWSAMILIIVVYFGKPEWTWVLQKLSDLIYFILEYGNKEWMLLLLRKLTEDVVGGILGRFVHKNKGYEEEEENEKPEIQEQQILEEVVENPVQEEVIPGGEDKPEVTQPQDEMPFGKEDRQVDEPQPEQIGEEKLQEEQPQEEKPQEEKPQEEQPQEEKPQEEKPQAEEPQEEKPQEVKQEEPVIVTDQQNRGVSPVRPATPDNQRQLYQSVRSDWEGLAIPSPSRLKPESPSFRRSFEKAKDLTQLLGQMDELGSEFSKSMGPNSP